MTCWTEDLPELPGIYKLTNKINGKIYIGQSKCIKRRMKGHRDRNPTLISSAIRKYGWENFKKEAIEIYPHGTPEITLLHRETFWIKFLKAHVIYGNYNFKENTISPHKRRENKPLNKTPKKIKKEIKKQTKDFYRSIQAEEVFGGKSIKQIDMETGEVIRTWPSLRSAAQAITGDPKAAGGIVKALKRKYGHKSSYGYYWEYDKSNKIRIAISEHVRKKISNTRKERCLSRGNKNPMFGRTHSGETRRKISQGLSPKRVAQIDKNTGEIIKIWESAKAAARVLSKTGNKSPIVSCINKTRSGCVTAFGYKWEYVEKEPL